MLAKSTSFLVRSAAVNIGVYVCSLINACIYILYCQLDITLVDILVDTVKSKYQAHMIPQHLLRQVLTRRETSLGIRVE